MRYGESSRPYSCINFTVTLFRDFHERMLLSTRTEELYLGNYRLHVLPLLKGRAIGSVDGRLGVS